MSLSKYKKWMIESYLYEADDDTGKHEDGDTWTTASGKYACKHKGEVDYFDDKEDASDYAKYGPSGMPDDKTFYEDYGQKWDTRQFFKHDFNKEVTKFMGGII